LLRSFLRTCPYPRDGNDYPYPLHAFHSFYNPYLIMQELSCTFATLSEDSLPETTTSFSILTWP
jgi:hypothetical protein